MHSMWHSDQQFCHRGYFTVDMTIGAVLLGLWQYFAPADALVSAPLVASALIAGDGVWTVPSAILALAKVTPPMCAQVWVLLSHIKDENHPLVRRNLNSLEPSPETVAVIAMSRVVCTDQVQDPKCRIKRDNICLKAS